METPEVTLETKKYIGVTYRTGPFSLTVRERDSSPEARARGDDLIFRLSHQKEGRELGKDLPRYQVENAIEAWEVALKKKDYVGPTRTVNVGGGPNANPHTLAYIKTGGSIFKVLYDKDGNLRSVEFHSQTHAFPGLTPETHALFTHALQNFENDVKRLNT